jgi:hypothetical protein
VRGDHVWETQSPRASEAMTKNSHVPPASRSVSQRLDRRDAMLVRVCNGLQTSNEKAAMPRPGSTSIDRRRGPETSFEGIQSRGRTSGRWGFERVSGDAAASNRICVSSESNIAHLANSAGSEDLRPLDGRNAGRPLQRQTEIAERSYRGSPPDRCRYPTAHG